jgi:hypothetical protein
MKDGQKVGLKGLYPELIHRMFNVDNISLYKLYTVLLYSSMEHSFKTGNGNNTETVVEITGH